MDNNKKKENKAILSRLITGINQGNSKKNKDGPKLVSMASDLPNPSYISTGVYELDRDLRGGFARGVISTLWGAPNCGKAQPLDCKILTPTGWKLMGDIIVGDRVMTQDGTATTITGVYPQGILDVYEVEFTDGAKTRCCGEHLWSVYKNNKRKSKDKPVLEIISTQNLQKSLRIENDMKRHKYWTPIVEPLQLEVRGLDLHPYALGAILGDAHIAANGAVRFCSADEELGQKLEHCLGSLGVTAKAYSKKTSKAIDYHFTGPMRGNREAPDLHKIMCSLGLAGKLSYEKFIPERYLFSCVKARLEILRGLMDTDGTVGKRGEISFTSTSERLVDDLTFLARSLGIKVTRKYQRIPTYKNAIGQKLEGRLSTTVRLAPPVGIDIFTLSRKLQRVKKTFVHAVDKHFIQRITKVSYEECQCIKVDHPSHLYVTDDCIATHNTSLAAMAAAWVQANGGTVVWIDTEDFSPLKAKELGVDLEELFLVRPNDYAEQSLNAINKMLYDEKTRQPRGIIDLIVVDSITNLVPKALVDGAEEKGSEAFLQLGRRAAMLAASVESWQGRHVLGSGPNGTAMICIAQERSDPSVTYGDPTKMSGGKAMPHASKALIRLKKGKVFTKKEGDYEQPQGHDVNYLIEKQAVDGPPRRGSYSVLYGIGPDDSRAVCDAAQEKDIIERSGRNYILHLVGEDRLLEIGIAEVRELVQKDQELKNRLKTALEEAKKPDGIVITGCDYEIKTIGGENPEGYSPPDNLYKTEDNE